MSGLTPKVKCLEITFYLRPSAKNSVFNEFFGFNELNSFSLMYCAAFNNSIQYIVSSHYFCAMESLWIKSGLDSAFNASLVLAPIEVPDFNPPEAEKGQTPPLEANK
ncbi:MAG: hypothetical protein FD143_2326 [Ignavibacteria bacterium]|nr:MAG: hypothetical protein FD143_2326 [Ignavibacteria bacterium]